MSKEIKKSAKKTINMVVNALTWYKEYKKVLERQNVKEVTK